MSLYNKYRPKDFDEMLGSREIIEVLDGILKNPERSHSYLFTGPAGCGKTTAARIFSKRLGVEDLAVQEVNSANNRGIDTARKIIDQMRSYPFEGKYWMWIIDEVHQTSKDFQNAMLKPLEDTPEHCYFFLCTTNPEKLVKPLKSRCTEVHFPVLGQKYISLLVKRVAEKEGVKLSEEVMEELVDVSQGSPRASLVALEKVMHLDTTAALRILRSGTATSEEEKQAVIDLCRALFRKDGTYGDVAEVLSKLYEEFSDWEALRNQVLGYAGAILLKGGNRRAALVIDVFSQPFYNSGKAGVTLACYNAMTIGG
jgi:DNA polymerase III gamma/tau subunit